MPFRFNPISKKLDLIGTATLDIRTVPATLAASTTAFTVVYNNGAAGVGATLTNAGALAAFSVDGLTPAVSSRILIKNQVDETQNGIYTVTTAGSGATAWVLTRATDYDTASEIDASLVPVLSGTVNANTSWLQSNDIVTVGTTAVVYTQFTANPATFLMRANNLSDVANATTSRDNLSLGVANSPQFTNLTLTGSINSLLNVTGGQMVVGTGGPFPTFFSQIYPTSSFTRGLYLSGVVSSGIFAAQALGIDTNVSITGNVANSNSAFITPTVSVAATFTLTKYAAFQINAGNPLSGGGTLTSAYGMHIVNPGYGTNRTALYSDNGSIGYEAVTPPTNGLIVSGNTSIGSSTATSLFNVGSANQFQIGTTGIVTSGTWNGTAVSAQYGGTGVATLTSGQLIVGAGTSPVTSIAYSASPGTNTVVSRDANGNSRAVNFISSATNVVSASGTTVLTVSSTRLQQLTGTLNQTFQLPDATTLTVGSTFEFNNNSTGILTVADAGSNTITTVPSGGYSRVVAIAVPIPNGVWDAHFLIPRNGSYGTSGMTVTGTITGTTSVSSPQLLLTGSSSGMISILPQAAAGTYNFNLPTTAGTLGYVLTSGGGGASPMTWSSLSSVAVTSITGTANQVIASSATGAVTLSLPQSIGTSSNVQFAQLGLGVAASNNQLSINGKASIGYSDTAAPANGLIVAGKVGVGTNAPIGSLSNTTTAFAPITSGIGLSPNGICFSDANVGYIAQFINTGAALGSCGLALTTTNVSAGNFVLNCESNAATRFLVESTGSVVVGGAALATNATTGFFYIPTCAGTPTGVPGTFSGRSAMIYDTSANKFWIYDGSWRGVVLT